MELKELLTTYWSQVTLILIAIGYFVKRLLDIKSRKIEINHSLFQTNRITSVNNFFSNYSKVDLMWDQIAIYDIFLRKLTANEIDRIIIPPLNDLKRSLLELKIYFKPEEYKYFDELGIGLSSINGKLSRLYFNVEGEIDVDRKIFEFGKFKSDVVMRNKELMDDLCEMLKKKFY
ncbi:MAG: hypothetical protein HQ541_08500 [Mariniphaga sp.]|nr:hypothetical protein [Mariniphaga sp.]